MENEKKQLIVKFYQRQLKVYKKAYVRYLTELKMAQEQSQKAQREAFIYSEVTGTPIKVSPLVMPKEPCFLLFSKSDKLRNYIGQAIKRSLSSNPSSSPVSYTHLTLPTNREV